ncbi:MAG: hypothetical protein J07AB43_11730 [Candidatus Nanosalina sp. J07AB43]|jgi:hypothetical protein|nr:MAG: hypothetical protein J07AB43_11730 [Candidatus Nanosalina sp. J07AB43]
MKKLLLLGLLTILAVSAASADEKKIRADLTFYDNETEVVVESVKVVESRQVTPLSQETGNYRFSLRDSSGRILTTGTRLISFRAVGPPGPRSDEGYSTTVGSREMSFWLEYDNRSRIFEIANNTDVVKRVNITQTICSRQEVDCDKTSSGYGVNTIIGRLGAIGVAVVLLIVILMIYRSRFS